MGIGPWHLLALVVIVLFFFGPSRLPQIGKGMGDAIRGFKKGLEGDNEEIDVTNSTQQQRRENLHASQDQNAQTQQQREKNRSDS